MDISAGNIKTSKDEIIIRSNNKKTSTKGVENIVVYSENNGDILRLKDIAKVEIKFSETPIQGFVNGQRAITLS